MKLRWNLNKIITFAFQNAVLAQLVRVSVCGSEGHGFESHRRYESIIIIMVVLFVFTEVM